MSRKLVCAFTLAALAVPLGIGNWSLVGEAQAQSVDADKKAALKAYKKGTIKYNLGEWTEAIALFKLAFETYPDAAFLFNIAQSYRQADDCQQGAFFYKRYLALKPDAVNKSEVKGFIRTLEATCKKRDALAARNAEAAAAAEAAKAKAAAAEAAAEAKAKAEADAEAEAEAKAAADAKAKADADAAAAAAAANSNNTVTTGTEGTAAATGTEGTEGTLAVESGGDIGMVADGSPSLFVARVSLGSAIMSIAGLDTEPQMNISLGGGYPFHFGSITVDAGALISYTTANWESPSATGSASLTAFLVNAGASMPVADKIRVNGEVGMGMMVYSGLDVPGNVFVNEGQMAKGSLSSASFRLALGAEYAINNNLTVSLQPLVLSFSPAADGMREGIDNVNSYQALLGVGYKM